MRSMLTKAFSLPLACLLSSGFLSIASAQETFVADDAGQPRQFELALDEVALSTPTARRVLTATGKAASATEQRRAATRLARDAGGEAELVVYEVVDGARRGTPRIVTVEVLFTVAPGADAEGLALQVGAASVKPTLVENTWIAVAADSGSALDLATALRALPGVASANPLLARQQARKLVPNDTFFTNQWHLRNTGQFSGVSGTDIRVTNVWDTYRGAGQVIAIIDDGLQTAHPDLSANVNTTIDYDINYGDGDPSPDIAGDDHGTACAGVAAARGNNSIGVSGSAPEATLVGLRLISAATSDSEEAQAINWSNSLIHIKSNSWGPTDDGATLEGPGTLTAAALSNACAVSRGGRGALIFWAGGNGGEDDYDDSNYDGYANSIYSIAIAAVCISATSSWYSESGANIVVAAPSGGDNTAGSDVGIWTTDRTGADGYNDGATGGEPADANYTATFGGTSSATPLAAGVGALMLQANTNLGWRDVQEILIRSATRVHPTDNDWRTNSAGIAFNHKYGGGMISASGAVAMALTWTNLGAQVSTSTNQTGLSVAIPDNNAAGVTRTFTVTNQIRIEHAVVNISATHPYRGDLKVELISPSGMTSVVGAVRGADGGDNYSNWKYMSVRHWGETAAGTWTVRVADRGELDTGTLTALGIRFYGTGAVLADQPPVLAPVGNQSVVISNNLIFAVSAADLADGDTVTLVASNLPSGATFPVTNGNGTFIWTNAAPTGTYSVTFHAWDVDGYDAETISVAVTPEPVVDTNCAIIFSEYVEGSSNNKAIEIFNPGASAVDLAAGSYVVQVYANGSATPGTAITLTGTVAAGGTYVVTHSSATATLLAMGQQRSANLNFNGNDAVLLRSGGVSGTILDSLGVVGTDPGTEWGTGLTSTADNTLRRIGTVIRGDTNTTDAFNPAVEWEGFASDTYSGLGVHTNNCAGGAPPAEEAPVLAAIGAKSVTLSNLLTFAVSATDVNSDPITLIASNLPSGATFPVTNGNGTFIWTNAAPTGTYSVTFHAFDDDGYDAETIAVTVNPAAVVDTNCAIIISEYVEGTSNNKAIEIFNPGASAVDLAAGSYVVHVYANGSVTPGTAITLTGTVAAGGTYVVTHSSATATLLAMGQQSSAHLNFNGNDAVLLRIGGVSGTILDSLGVVGTDPGTEWGSGLTSTADNTLRRKAAVTRGDTNTTDTFNPATEWDGYATDTFAGLGSHTNDCAGGAPDSDTDDDGIEDAWEMTHFGSLTNVSAASDWDNDGFLDLHEFLAGSNPTNAASLLEATATSQAAGAGGFIVTWQSESNKNYMLARSTNLLQGFVGIASNIPAVYPLNTYTDAAAPAASSVYRVELE